MPRQPRVHLDGGCYHVTLRGNHRRDIFVAEGDQRLLNRIVARAVEKYRARVHAYCWMSNHLHLLVQVSDEPLGQPMRQIAAEFARAMQSKMQTTGHFFERRYHATLVDVDTYLKSAIRYIHLNPVEAGIVSDPGAYPWSSHRAYLGAPHEPWLVTDFALRNFGSTRELAIAAYRQFMEIGGAPWPPTEVDEAQSAAKPFTGDAFASRAGKTALKSGIRQSLAELIAEACARFEVDLDALSSPVRNDYLTKVRAWIAYQARIRLIASLAEVARELNRHEATLRQAMRRYPEEIR